MNFILTIVFLIVVGRFCWKASEDDIKKRGKDAVKEEYERGKGIFY